MKKLAGVALIVVAVVLLTAPSSPAHAWRGHGTRVFVGTGFWWWGPPVSVLVLPLPLLRSACRDP